MSTSRKVYTPEEVKEFVTTLSTTDPIKFTKEDRHKIREFIDSDGCTGVPDFFKGACIEHDFYYRTHMSFDGAPITRKEADWLFRNSMQRIAILRKLSPLTYIYWLGTRVLGWFFWTT